MSSGDIRVKVDGDEIIMPDDDGNRYFEPLMAWVKGGGVIAPYLPPAPDDVSVNVERDRRMNGGFVFDGKLYDSTPDARENITGASLGAFMAKAAGAQAGDFRWQDPSKDFSWIAHDNTSRTMDVDTVIAFGNAAMNWKQAHIFAARAMKDSGDIPADYTADKYWPERGQESN